MVFRREVEIRFLSVVISVPVLDDVGKTCGGSLMSELQQEHSVLEAGDWEAPVQWDGSSSKLWSSSGRSLL